MNPRRRILLVKPVLPYPPDQGTKVVSFSIIEALAGNCEVTVLARLLDAEEESMARALEERGVRVVTVLPPNRRHRAARVAYRLAYGARSLFAGRSLKGLYDCPGVFVKAARELSRESFDLVILEYWQLHPLLDVFPRGRCVLLTHDIDLLVNRDRVRLETGLLARAAALHRWRLEQREEVRAYRRAPRILALTRRDADAVRVLSRERAEVGVLPFGLPDASFSAAGSARDSREVLFLGALGAAFNRDALEHFVRDIHPLLASLDGVRFTVVGGPLPADLQFFGGFRNVDIAGHAPDTRPYLLRAGCLVVPLRYAGGLRIRIVEAMAAGLPVVASPAAVAGLDVEAGRHVLVARSPVEYRAHVERLFTDPAFAARLSEEARTQAWEHYGPEARGPLLRRCVERLAAQGGGPPGAEASGAPGA